MRKNKISMFMSLSLMLSALFFSSFDVFAMEKEEGYIFPCEQAEVTDTELLIQRAKDGIDEFKENTGVEFSVVCEKTDLLISYTTTPKVCSESVEEKYSVETYKTSQYLGKVLNEKGEWDDLYAFQGIVAYSDFENCSDTKTNGGCTITTTIYFQWAPDVFGIKLLRSTCVVSGTLRPSSLKMENQADEGWVTDANPELHYNTRTISLPSNGTYTLDSPYSGYVYHPNAYVMAEDTVFFGSGGTLKTHVVYSV